MSRIELLDELESALEEYDAGYSNPHAVRVCQSLLKELEDSSDAPKNLVAEKAGSIRHWLPILYSPRKHQRYGGVERVKLFIRHDLASLRTMFSTGSGKR